MRNLFTVLQNIVEKTRKLFTIIDNVLETIRELLRTLIALAFVISYREIAFKCIILILNILTLFIIHKNDNDDTRCGKPMFPFLIAIWLPLE